MKNICIVDDDKEIVRILTALLESDGYQVTSADNAIAGWAIIQQTTPSVLLVDWQMPKMSGIELIKRVKSDTVLGNMYIVHDFRQK